MNLRITLTGACCFVNASSPICGTISKISIGCELSRPKVHDAIPNLPDLSSLAIVFLAIAVREAGSGPTRKRRPPAGGSAY